VADRYGAGGRLSVVALHASFEPLPQRGPLVGRGPPSAGASEWGPRAV